MASRTGKLSTSDFMKMDKNDPRRQRWEETANKAHAQGMKELDKARYGSGSRQKAVQDPDSLEARVRDNSSTYGKTAEGKAYLHNKDQQAKSQAGADARTAARDYATQRKEDTKAAYLEGQAEGRAKGRSDQAAASRGRGRGGYGGPPRGYGGRGGDPRQMRGGRGGFSSNPFRSGGRGRGGGRGISSGGRTINPVRSGGGSRGMVDQATVDAIGSQVSDQINKHNQAKGGPTFKHKSSGPVSKEKLAEFAAHMKVQMDKANKDTRKATPPQTPPPKAAPPKGGMNTGATTDLREVQKDSGKTPPPKATKPPITPPSYQEPARDYIKYKDKKPRGVSSDADRYALLTGRPSMGGGTTTPKGGSSTPDYSYDYGLGKDTSDDADRYALLSGKYSGKSYLDKYLNR